MKTNTPWKVTLLMALGGIATTLFAIALKRLLNKAREEEALTVDDGTGGEENTRRVATALASSGYPPDARRRAPSRPRQFSASPRTLPRRGYYHHGDR